MKKLLVALLVLLVLLGVADRVAVHVADRTLASELQGDLGVKPDVSIKGFPFLTQALAGRYRSIEVHAKGVRRQRLRLTEFTGDLSGVHVPLSDVLGGTIAKVPVDRLQGTALLSYADLAAAVPGRALELEPVGDEVRVTGRLTILGQTLTASTLADARIDNGALVLTGRSYEVGGQAVSSVINSALAGQLDVRVPLRDLPYGARISSVTTDREGLRVSGSASDLVLKR